MFVATLLAVSPAAATTLTRGPYLQLLTTHSVTVVWNTATAAACGLAIHPVGGSDTVIASGAGTVCAVAVDGLTPGTSYAYVPLADGLPLLDESIFATDDPSRPFTFLVFGDSGVASAAQYAVAGRMLASPADFVLHTGDMIYPGGAAADFNPKFFVPYRDLLRRLVLWPCLGNHDVITNFGAPWRDAFFTPANNPAASEDYYSFDYGNAHVAVIDSDAATIPGSAQYAFLDADLGASAAPWKFVAFHHTIYSSGSHGSDVLIQANLAPLFDRQAVDVVFMGHDHVYERTFPLRANAIVPSGAGTVYVTTGGGGQSLTAAGASTFTAHAESTYHFTRVSIDGESLLLQMIGADGLIHDTMTVVKDAPPPAPQCGDGLVNQAGEQCDGADHTACVADCRPECTCAPTCGDGVIDQASETCDGGDDAACPDRCLADCRCGDLLVFAPVADTYVDASLPNTNFGSAALVTADASPISIAYLRFVVSGLEGREVVRAVLRLTADAGATAASPSGGNVHRISDVTWDEAMVTYTTRPLVDGPTLVSAGAIVPSQVIDLDVTPAVGGEGAYSFALDSTSTDGVRYRTREVASGGPQLLLAISADATSGGSSTTTTITTTSTTTGPSTTTITTTTTTIGTPLGWEAHVRASADDAEENLTSTSAQYRQVSLTSTDLEMVRDTTGATCAGCDQLVGMRWTGVAVAPRARITRAYVEFWVDEAQSEITSLTLVGEVASSAAPFSTTAGNLSARSPTAASVAWPVPAWTVGVHNDTQRTPDLSFIIQEIVDRPGWASGNALALLVTGSGHRTAQAWDLNGGNPTQSPLLHIETDGGTTTSTSTTSTTSTVTSTSTTVSTSSSSTTSSTTSSSSTSTTSSTTTTSSTSSSSTSAPPTTTSSTSSSSTSVSSSTTSSTASTTSSTSSSSSTTTSTSTSTSSSSTSAPPTTTSSTSTSSSSSPTTTSTTTSSSTTTFSSTTLPAGGTTVYQAGVSGPAASAAVDTYVRLSSTGTNYGGDSSLYVGVTNDLTKVHRTLMAFGLPDIPAGAVVTSCTLTVNVTQRTSPTPGHVRRLCGEHWLDGNGQGEAQATWAQWRSGQSWGGAGASSTAACAAGGDYTTAGEVTYTPPAGTGPFTFPALVALCQDAITNRGGWLRLRISQDAETRTGNLIRFDSSDATSATNRPRLSVTWSAATPATSTTTSTSTSTTSSTLRSTTTTLSTPATTTTLPTSTTTTTLSTPTTTTSTTSSTITLPAGGTAVYQSGVSGPAASAAADTYVRLSTTSTNYGGDASLYVGVTNDVTKVYRTLIAFDLSNIPPGATIRTCTLAVNVTQRTSPTPGHVRRLCGEHWLDGDGQGEAQATWAQWRSGQAWGGAGASSTAACAAGGDYATAGEIAYTPPTGTGAFTFPDLSALCQDAIAQRGGWLRLRISQDVESTQSNLIKFDSSDASTAANRPKLTVTW